MCFLPTIYTSPVCGISFYIVHTARVSRASRVPQIIITPVSRYILGKTCEIVTNWLVFTEMDLNQINSFTSGAALYQNKPVKKLTDLAEGLQYTMLNLKIVKTKFGDVPLVEMDDFVTFLPGRCTKIIEENLKTFTPFSYQLVYTGMQNSQNPGYRPFAAFKIVENYFQKSRINTGVIP